MLSLVDARYRCTSCGDCCREWDVPLESGEADRFRKQIAPLVPAERLTAMIGTAVHRGVTLETLAGNARGCVALDEQKLCRIHATYGEEQKPAACRIFPFTFVTAPNGDVRVGLSFACPAVVDNEGPLLEEQRASIETIYAAVIEGSRYQLKVPDPVPIDRKHTLPWAQAEQLVGEIATHLEGEGALVERVCGAGSACALMLMALDEGTPFDEAFASVRENARALAADALGAELHVDRLSRAMFSTLLRVTQPITSFARFRGLLASLAGGGAVLLESGAQVPMKKVERVRPGLGSDGERLYARWFSVALRGFTFFGEPAFGLPLAAGLDLMALLTAVGAYLARAYAAAADREAVSLDDAKAGLRQLDGGLRHRSGMPPGFDRALEATAALGLLREQLG